MNATAAITRNIIGAESSHIMINLGGGTGDPYLDRWYIELSKNVGNFNHAH